MKVTSNIIYVHTHARTHTHIHACKSRYSPGLWFPPGQYNAVSEPVNGFYIDSKD